MIYRFNLILLAICLGCSGTKAPDYPGNLSFVQVAETADLRASGRGAEQWHDQNAIPVFFPYDSMSYSPDKYYRFSWVQLEKGDGEFDWAVFDREIQNAIDNRQTFSFGIMPTCPSCVDGDMSIRIDGKIASYPAYLHDQMQSESTKDWISTQSEMWVPNWNSTYYLNALKRLNKAVAERLQSQEYKDIKYSDVIRYIDIRGFGSYGEWHEGAILESMSEHPKGTQATATTLKEIVDIHLDAFNAYRLVALLGSLDAELLRNTQVPTEIGYHVLQAKTRKGPIGIRRDNWGATDTYIKTYMENHPVEYKGLSFRQTIAERWKTAPILGEPIHDAAIVNGCALGDLLNQVQRYHASSIANGNFYNNHDACLQESYREAIRAAGFRLSLLGGYLDPVVVAGNKTELKLYWINQGVAPLYEDWNVHYQLYDLRGDSLVWETTSKFSPTMLMPADTATEHSDEITFPTNLAGHYNIRLVISDPAGYRAPLPLAIQGRLPDGSYTIRSIEILPPQ